MKITKLQLKQIIKEELGRVMEQDDETSGEGHLEKLKGMYFEGDQAEHAKALASSLGIEDQLMDIIDDYYINIFNGIMFDPPVHDEEEFKKLNRTLKKQVARATKAGMEDIMDDGFARTGRSFEELIVYLLMAFPDPITPRADIPGNPKWIDMVRTTIKQLGIRSLRDLRDDAKVKIAVHLKKELQQAIASGEASSDLA